MHAVILRIFFYTLMINSNLSLNSYKYLFGFYIFYLLLYIYIVLLRCHFVKTAVKCAIFYFSSCEPYLFTSVHFKHELGLLKKN